MTQMGDSLPSTSLLWGEECIPNDDITKASTSTSNKPNTSNFRDKQCQNFAQLIEREGITQNDIGASTSRCPKPSWCKHGKKSSKTYSNEYEWDTLWKLV